MQRTIKVKILIVFSIVFIVISLLIGIYLSEFTLLEPKSAGGVQLVARSFVDFRSTTSCVYIKYPDQIKLKKTGVVFSEDEGYALTVQEDNLSIKWLDDHHVSITFKGRDYYKPETKIIEY